MKYHEYAQTCRMRESGLPVIFVQWLQGSRKSARCADDAGINKTSATQSQAKKTQAKKPSQTKKQQHALSMVPKRRKVAKTDGTCCVHSVLCPFDSRLCASGTFDER
jgi:hypothetical protein